MLYDFLDRYSNEFTIPSKDHLQGWKNAIFVPP